MAARQDKKSLQNSSSSSKQVPQNPSSASKFLTAILDPTIESVDGKFIKSSSAIFAHPKASGSQVGESSRSAQAPCCALPPNAEEAPVDAGAQQNNLDVEEEMEHHVDARVEEPRANCCSSFYDCYTDAVMKFRNSAFIYLLQILIASIPVSAAVMGFVYLEDCPKAAYLPRLGAGIGGVGLLFMGIWMTISRYNRRGTTLSAKQKFAFVVFCVLLTIASAVDAVLVYCLVPSSDPTSKDYCDETFYTYSCYKEVATVVVVVFSMLLYIPGMRHTVCCEECHLSHSGRYYAL